MEGEGAGREGEREWNGGASGRGERKGCREGGRDRAQNAEGRARAYGVIFEHSPDSLPGRFALYGGWRLNLSLRVDHIVMLV